MRRAQHQKGTMQAVTRKSGQDVWVYRWFEPDQTGGTKRIKRVIGPLTEFPKEKDAWGEVERLGLGQSFDQFGPRTLKQLAEHFTRKELPEEQDDDGLAFSTKESYRLNLRKWVIPRWGTSPLSDIKAVNVEEWLKGLKRTEGEGENALQVDLAPGTKKKIRDLMHVLFEHAIRWEWAERNPITAVRQGSKRLTVPKLLTVAELSSLLFKSLGLRERVMVFLDFGTGLRRGELAGLTWADVDFQKSQIVPRRSIVKQRIGPVKTEVSGKAIPLDDSLVGDLLTWRRETPYARDSDYVFASAKMKGTQPYWLSRIMQHHIKPAAEKLGIQLKGFHTLRHTYCTLLAANGNDTKVVQELLRHQSFKVTTDTYMQALTDDKRNAHSGVIRLLVPREVPQAPAVIIGKMASC
jgi:integrase